MIPRLARIIEDSPITTAYIAAWGLAYVLSIRYGGAR